MRVAALNDIHGNLPALEAVLAEVRGAGVDQIVIGGDVYPGPMSGECLARLLELDIPVQCIRGNCENELLAEVAGTGTGRLSTSMRERFRWEAEHLAPEYAQLLADWPATLRLTIDGVGEVLFCHATPRDDNEIFTKQTPEERLAPVFAGVDAAVVVCGHTHMQFDRMVGSVRVVNAGSVGSSFAGPGAYWLLLGPTVELRQTPYDLERAAERIRATPYPHAQEFAEESVLHPPSAEATLEKLSGAELR